MARVGDPDVQLSAVWTAGLVSSLLATICWCALWVGVRASRISGEYDYVLLLLPLPTCFFTFTALITDWVSISMWREHRYDALERDGRCIHCGYDLRASKDNCPECGFPIVLRNQKHSELRS